MPLVILLTIIPSAMKMTDTLKLWASIVALFAINLPLGAQTIDIGPPDTSVCNGTPVTLTAILQGTAGGAQPATYQLTDDTHTGVVNMGFDFVYYGQTYNQCVISSNSYITFDLSQANQYSPWSIGGPAPNAAAPNSMVMFPWQDTNPGVGGTVSSVTCGIAPFRRFVVTYDNVAMFSCTNMSFTNQLVLYETTNHIEMHITSKPLCAAWNSGAAIQGIENETGAIGHIVPGRNFPTQWQVNNDGYEFIPNGATNYTVNAIPFNPVPVTTNDVVTWYDAAGNVLGTGLTLTVTPNVPTWYYAEWDYPCNLMPAEDSIYVTLGNVNITATPTAASCNGFSDGRVIVDPVGSNFPVSLQIVNTATGAIAQSVNGVNGIYNFQNLPAGDYQITVTDGVGCQTQLLTVIGQPTPLVVNAGHFDILCAGELNGRAFATASGSVPPYSLLWNDPLMQTTDTIRFLPVGAYTVTVTDANGCIKDTTVVVQQPAPLVVDIVTGPDTCELGNGAVTAFMTGGVHPYIYKWSSIRDSSHLVINPQPGAFGANTGLSQGEFIVLVTDSNGCEIEGRGTVGLIPSPVAAFSSRSKPEEFTNPEVLYVNESTGSVSWEWHFGDGMMSNEENPRHLYESGGSYLVMLVSMNDPRYGCRDTTYRYMDVDPYLTFWVPNAFTPDNNGINDVWMPYGANFEYESYNVQIYDRWGKMVWQTDNPRFGWDGKDRSSGNLLTAGVYTYIFTLKRHNTFEPKVITGSVTLYQKRQ